MNFNHFVVCIYTELITKRYIKQLTKGPMFLSLLLKLKKPMNPLYQQYIIYKLDTGVTTLKSGMRHLEN